MSGDIRPTCITVGCESPVYGNRRKNGRWQSVCGVHHKAEQRQPTHRARLAAHRQTQVGHAALARAAAVRATKTGRWKQAVYTALTRDEWCTLYDSQHGRCACCGKPLRDRWRDPDDQVKELAACDHDHDLETVLLAAGYSSLGAVRRSIRGLLCAYPCNKLWPRYFTAERLFRLAEFALALPAQRVLIHAEETGCAVPGPEDVRAGAAAASAEAERGGRRPRGFAGLVQ